MKIIEPGFEIVDLLDGNEMLKRIERAGRVCYKSEAGITNDSAIRFVKNIIRSGHESVIEHEKITVKIICDRGVSHEIVRHRIASYSQESTRYCNYYAEKFGNELTFIKPYFWNKDFAKYKIWENTMLYIEKAYMELIEAGAKPQEARSILPNSLKTEIIVTMNLREWRHFFKLRADKAAHPQMRQIALPLLKEFQNEIPVIFDNLIDEEYYSS
ncbi:MAG: FAD-dependent thymidylate synthase [Lachnospiraceae bacterium]|nr:FAD-dependent thymidylate synthase [Lachnospiraceae bacterium]